MFTLQESKYTVFNFIHRKSTTLSTTITTPFRSLTLNVKSSTTKTESISSVKRQNSGVKSVRKDLIRPLYSENISALAICK